MKHRAIRSALLMLAATAALTSCSLPANETSSADSKAGSSARPAFDADRALSALAVKDPAPKSGYDRTAKFGSAWSDTTTAPGASNGCDTRQDILRRDLTQITYKGSGTCTVEAGQLQDPYTGQTIAFRRGPNSADVQIDHIVALSASWVTGAARLPPDRREALANDPLNLIAASGPANQQKSDSDASRWLPPNEGFRCLYVARQIAVKAKYGLWVTPAERDAMRSVLLTCPHQPLPSDASSGVALPK